MPNLGLHFSRTGEKVTIPVRERTLVRAPSQGVVSRASDNLTLRAFSRREPSSQQHFLRRSRLRGTCWDAGAGEGVNSLRHGFAVPPPSHASTIG